jgi:hypothetical protein
MSEGSASLQNILSSQRTREKLDAYQVGLVFTLLGLSVQTATFGRPVVADILELSGWLALLIAGLAGLWRLERIPELYKLYSELARRERIVLDAETGQAQGATVVRISESGDNMPINEYLSRWRALAKEWQEEIEPHRWRGIHAYRLMKATFVIGLSAVIASRGYEAVVSIIDRLSK